MLKKCHMSLVRKICSPMLHIKFKKEPCHLSLGNPMWHVNFKKVPCHPIEFRKRPCRPVDFRGLDPLFDTLKEKVYSTHVENCMARIKSNTEGKLLIFRTFKQDYCMEGYLLLLPNLKHMPRQHTDILWTLLMVR